MRCNRFRTSVIAIVTVAVLVATVTSCRSDISDAADPVDPSIVEFNQGLETVVNGRPIGWVRYGYGSNQATWSLTSSAHTGNVAQVLKIKRYRSGDRKLIPSMYSAGLPVEVGKAYDLSAWYKLSGIAHIVVFRRSGSGVWTYWASGPTLKRTSSWRKSSFTTPPIPADTTAITFGVALESNGSLTTDDYAFTDTSSTTPSSSTSAPTTSTTPPPVEPLFLETFARPDGLITNEFSYWNPTSPLRVDDTKWELDGGSLFTRSEAGWTGIPDDIDPDPTSSNGTDSAIFRALTKRDDFSDVAVSFKVRRNALITTGTTPAVDWDGEHVLLRHVSQYSLYYASFDRRDGTTAIKKKIADGPSNEGVYYTLDSRRAPMTPGVWHDVRATIEDRADGSVLIQLWVDGALVGSAVDNGVGGPVIRSGQVGIRSDNADFDFDDFRVDAI